MSERVYYRKKTDKWEARFPRGVDKNGKTRYGSVFADTREAAIQRRAELVGLNPKEPANMSELNILILGAGSYGHEVKEVLERIRIFKKIAFLDDNIKDDDIKGKCCDADLFRLGFACAFVAIGDNERRKQYGEMLKRQKFYVPTIISPDAIVSPNAEIGLGTMIFAQGNVGACKLGEYCLVQPNAVVNAESSVGDYCRMDNGAIILKGENVPNETWIKPGVIFGNV